MSAQGARAREARPGAGLHTTAACFFAVLAYATSVPGTYFGALGLGAVGWSVVSGWWLWLFVRAGRARWSSLRGHPWHWLAVPLATVALALHLPLYARFLASYPALQARAEHAWQASEAGAQINGAQDHSWCGLYPVAGVWVEPDDRCVIFPIPGTGFLFDRGGFVHAPPGAPENSPNEYTHIFGDWYTVVFDD